MSIIYANHSSIRYKYTDNVNELGLIKRQSSKLFCYYVKRNLLFLRYLINIKKNKRSNKTFIFLVFFRQRKKKRFKMD